MWRQLGFVCLLLTLPDFWTGAHARLEQAVPDLAEYIDTRSPNKEIAKAAEEPGNTVISQGTQEKPSTQKNDSETENKHGTAQPQVQKPGGGHKSAGTIVPVMMSTDVVFIVTVAACSIAGLIGIIMAGVCWYRLNRSAKAASDVDYPAYGVTGPTKERIPSPGDRKLAQSAQMYHYQHQKQQMIAMEKANGEMKHDASDEESEEENEEGDYTVYECPGLAPTGEMEVKNPLFSDDAPATPGQEDRKDDGN